MVLAAQAELPVVQAQLQLLGDEDDVEGRVAVMGEDTCRILGTMGGAVRKPADAQAFFLRIEYKSVGGQQLTANCMYCSRQVVSTGATRLVDHLRTCSLAPIEVKRSCTTLVASRGEKRKAKAESVSLVNDEADMRLGLAKSHRAELVQQGIKAGLKVADSVVADHAIANFFYANAIPFGAADNAEDSLYRVMVRAIQQAPPAYVPPNRGALGGALIDVLDADLARKIAKRDEDGALSNRFGVAYTSDGWESCDKLPLINSAYITANDGGVYLRSVDTSGHIKNAEYVAALIIVDIYTIGCTKTVLECTDTCAVMRKAWRFVEDEFPWLSSAPCSTHCGSLLTTDIGKAPEVVSLMKDEGTVVTWFSNHQKPLAILRAKTKALYGKTRELVKAGGTRFGTNTLVGSRLMELEVAMQQTVVDPDYVAQNYKDLPDDHDITNCETVSRTHKGALAKKFVLDDGFWGRVKSHVAATMPLFKFIRRHDTSAPSTGKVYYGWFETGEHLKSQNVPYKSLMIEKHRERWDYSDCPFYYAGYVLDPEFHGHSQQQNADIMEGFMTTLERLAILFEVRRLEALDGRFSASWAARAKAIEADPMAGREWTDYPTGYPNTDTPAVKAFCSKANAQLVMYRSKKGIFGRAWVMDSAKEMPAYLWWDANGASVPELQAVACIVLAQPASASICERINSEFAFVKDRRRNKLSHIKANKLVRIFHNLRLMNRMNKAAYSEPAVGWLEEPEKAGILKYGVSNYGLLE
jgi:hypothetical protein